jgi:hypothetical protein
LERRPEVVPVPADQCRCPRCQKELAVIGYECSNGVESRLLTIACVGSRALRGQSR